METMILSRHMAHPNRRRPPFVRGERIFVAGNYMAVVRATVFSASFMRADECGLWPDHWIVFFNLGDGIDDEGNALRTAEGCACDGECFRNERDAILAHIGFLHSAAENAAQRVQREFYAPAIA